MIPLVVVIFLAVGASRREDGPGHTLPLNDRLPHGCIFVLWQEKHVLTFPEWLEGLLLHQEDESQMNAEACGG